MVNGLTGYFGRGAVARVTLSLALATASPVIAWLLDPGLQSDVHRYLLGAFVILFVIGDTFTNGAISSYGSVSSSPALTIREMGRLQLQLERIRSALRQSWWAGLLLRVLHTIVVSMLLAQDQGAEFASLALVGYALLGISTSVVISLSSTFWQAEQFLEAFKMEARLELEREKFLPGHR